ncbi:MAG TPA: SDR family NAD(P)-dependent oxidoreductase [Candidatus Angelobacter sp.]|nr:SDR family NAD(P)-dependent oxidoreductase [Candidatus Angelobacter sp.]
MLELLNRYSHGLAAIPIIHALKQRGCLAWIEAAGPFCSEQLEIEFSGNRGYVEVALRMLTCLGWLRCPSAGRYEATAELARYREVPDRILELYRFPFHQYVERSSGESLAFWLKLSARRWNIDHAVLPDYLDGLLIIPLLLELKAQRRLDVIVETGALDAIATLCLRLDQPVRREVERLFVSRKWASARSLRLNRVGRFIIDRIHITAALASYRPMFSCVEDLLFGDHARVFAPDLANRETHVDRTLNVRGSGFQHEKYFSALCDLVVQVFDHGAYASQPKYIVDMGCGDGSMLRRIYETVRDRTRRGQVLEQHPLILIAVDFNDEALFAASQTLDGIDHITFKGDIGDPAGLMQSLRERGIDDAGRVLHVRAFMDHNRRYVVPETHDAAQRRPRFGGSCIYVDVNGSSIPAGDLIQSTIEHLQRWAKILNEHGMLALEVHCLSAQATATYLDESESFHFDTYHSLSHQYPLEAETFLACAAEAGLFCRKGHCVGFPAKLEFTRITLSHFEKRPYTVRHACAADLMALTDLDCASRASPPVPAQDPVRWLETQLREFSEGQFVLVMEGQIVAAICCLRANSPGSVSVGATFGDQSYVTDLLQFVEQYWAVKKISVAGIEDCLAEVRALPARHAVAPAVARDVTTLVAKYPFAAENDPRDGERELGIFALRWVVAHLQRMGALRQPEEVYQLRDLKQLLRIAPKYDRYFEALLRRFDREGLVRLKDLRVETTTLVREYALQSVPDQVADFKENFQQRHPACASHLNLTACCLARYEEILTGAIDVTNVLFEDANMDVFKNVFCGDAVSDYFNRIVADAVNCTILRLQPLPTKVRILEIGAGTGGATIGILEVLESFAGLVEFCFSDVSLAFTRHAKDRFADRYPWIDYRSLDIEQDLSRQGFGDHTFDIIVASNVLHDTHDIEVTLQQTRRLLRAGGLLIMNEYTSVKDCLSFSGALLHGWWLFRDPQRRLSDSCLLSVPQWRSALEHTGFELLQAFALPTQSPNSECSQSVMLCEATERPNIQHVQNDVQNDGSNVAKTVIEGARSTRKHGIVGDFVEQDILVILGPERAKGYLTHRPVMELGLDSIELVELRQLLEKRFSVKLSPSFLFEYETHEKMVEALVPLVSEEKLRDRSALKLLDQADHESDSGENNQEAASVRPRLEKEPIAIIGVACRFPGGATSPDKLWTLLERGAHGIVPMPPNRWEWPAFVDVNEKHKGIDRGGFLARIDEFDASFFRTSPREAELMDPQQRLLLELSWEALEDAGHQPAELSGREVGVFVGACHFDYRDVLVASSAVADAYIGSGSAQSMLANRLSYFYDLKGPSLCIDTACSSSLVALHEAVCAIRRGDCEQAIVGGVNLLCSPTNSVAYYLGGMLSPTGECRAFDAAANGFVRGEGGAVLLLKPLYAALADRDAIYGLIKGAAVNHGGQAASLTAPKPDAQAAVIEAAWLDAGVPAESVGYIETHGTGTRLGDPVEISGLTEAFRRLYNAQGSSWPVMPRCAVGSVKTNLGHLEGAAGLAGLIKVLMSMRRGLLLATVNFERLNPEIDLKASPLFIVERNQVWHPYCDAHGNELPRRAGVSSFGFGGANAHIVVEEYRGIAQEFSATDAGPWLIVLSARSQAQLVAQAGRLADFMERANPSLREVAYTLQVGRTAMRERLAFIVKSNKALIFALRSYVTGEPTTLEHFHSGTVEDRLDHALADTAKQAINTYISSKDLLNLSSLWVKGVEIDWERLYGESKPRRLSLPTYPFARERYWPDAPEETQVVGGVARLHAVVHQNTSDLEEQRYSTTFTGQEFFLGDHRIAGQRLLPAVVYLEMVREAVTRARQKSWEREGERGAGTLRLMDVTWLRPLMVREAPVEVHIGLYPERDGIAFEIYSGSVRGEGGEVVYAKGVAVMGAEAAAPRLDVGAIKARCQAGSYEAASCYAVLDEQGIVYGKSHRGIEALYVGLNEAVAKLRLPSSVWASRGDFVLHPSLMDSSLQATIGFSLTGGEGAGARKRALPFALRTAEIHGACTEKMWAVVRREEAGADRKGISRYDIDLCDEEGWVCVRLKGLATRVSGGSEESASRAAGEVSSAIRPVVVDGLQADVQAELMRAISKLMKLQPDKIRADAEFSGLGLDSIALIGLADQLSAEYGIAVKPYEFFESPTLEGFSGYLVRTWPDVMAAHFAVQAGGPPVVEAPEGKALEKRRVRRSRFALVGATGGGEAAEGIAIIGMSGRFPMAKDVDELWENLLSGRDCIGEIPPERWDWRAVYGDPGEENKTDIKWGGFIAGMDEFDPQFFNISTREAELMDPQQRLLMIHIWKAIEDAGYAPSKLWGSNTGIFVGTGLSDYARLMAQAKVGIEGYTAMGTVASVGPNRMSYFLNLHGPSEPIETTCSSSLVAIHRAVSAMRSGHCEMAIVGGVNTILTPDLHISCTKAGMLSGSGRCRTFSDRADGYVRSEGVGILVLKRLAAAEQAGDHIYGVILGSAENHGGRANSFTSPNPQAQAELLRRAYTQAGVDPASVSYIEAHGTGTQLGDPVEVDGLKTAFRDLYQSWGSEVQAGHCGLGSVKSNIGHLELAAGVAGVIKVLLQMKHRILVPGLHCETINPYIQLEGSPFYIVRERTEWKTGQNGDNVHDLPRRAGVSSFGFGGVNAHVVLEEYVPRIEIPRRTVTRERPALVVLSARDEVRLHEQAEGLQAALGQQRFDAADLIDIAYTLQVGRNAMEERLGLLVNSISDLEQKLQAFLNNKDEGKREGVYRGQGGKNQDVLGILRADSEFHTVIDRWIEQHQSEKLLDVWVKGVEIDWERLYGESKPRRLSLPTYPFARKRCWLPKSKATGMQIVHPLLNQTEAGDSGFCFSTVLTGAEDFLTDHVIQGRKVLPAVVYLEIARAAAEHVALSSISPAAGQQSAIALRNVVWLRPFIVGAKPAQLHLRLTPNDTGLGFEISSNLEGTDRGGVVYARGHARASAAVPAPVLDIAGLHAQCDRLHYSGNDCYQALRSLGFHSGPAHRCISEIHVGNEELLAKIQLRASPVHVYDGFVLHPGVADSAIQAIIGFMLADRRSDAEAIKPALPAELDSVEIFAPCALAMWALIRRDKDKFDIDLCDEDGRVSVRFRGWAAQPLEGELLGFLPVEAPVTEEVVLTQVWEPVSIMRLAPRQALATGGMVMIGGTCDQRLAIQRLFPDAKYVELATGETVESICGKIVDLGEIGHVVWLVPQHLPDTLAADSMIAEQSQGVLSGFRLIKAMLAAGYGARILTWTVLTVGIEAVHATELANPTHASVHGLMGSAANEHPSWTVRLIDLPDSNDWPWEDLFAVQGFPHGNALFYREGRWYRQQLVPYRLINDAPMMACEGEVYVILGGHGGIGSAWSEALLRRSRVQLVWIGRRPMDNVLQARLDRLASLGPAPLYISADATDLQQLESARTMILQKFGRVDGLVHAAMVLHDRSLANMTEDAFSAALRPKIDGTVRLAQVFGRDALRFVLFFSSCNAFIKSAGQSNYVAGCTFLDSFARRMSREWPCKVRIINWGYWGSIGAVASERYQALMAGRGFGSIELPEATRILDELLCGPEVQVAYLKVTQQTALSAFDILSGEWVTGFRETQPSCLTAIERVGKANDASEWSPSHDWCEAEQEIDALLINLLRSQLQSAGIFGEKGASWEEAQSSGKVQTRFRLWFEHSIRLVATNGYPPGCIPQRDGLDLVPADSEDAWGTWESKKGQWLKDPELEAGVKVVESVLHALPDILAGRRDATDIFADVFASGSTPQIARIMRRGPVIRFCNETIAQAVVQYILERCCRDSHCQLKILEIGARTRSTTEGILAAIEPHASCLKEYACTDTSMQVLSAARRWAGSERAYLNYQLFDVERSPEAQGMAIDSYDLVIASNVLHATRDIHTTLRNAKALLKTNGLLILHDVTVNTTFDHLTVGLLDGWWQFSDTEPRITGGPALLPAGWRAVLQLEGFGPVLFPAGKAHDYGHQVIVAESDGVVRQRLARSALLQDQVGADREPGNIVAPRVADDGLLTRVDEVMSRPRNAAITYLLSTVRMRTAETLGVDIATLDAQSRPFADMLLGELGMDSLSSNNLRNTLRLELGVDIPLQRIVGGKVQSLIDALYDALLIRRVSGVADSETSDDRETYVF